MLNRSGLPLNPEKYESSPQALPFRRDLTPEEKSFIKRKHLIRSAGEIFIYLIIMTVSIFVANYLFSLNNEGLRYFGIILIIAAAFGVMKKLFAVVKTDYAVCSNGLIVRTFTQTHRSRNSKEPYNTEFVSVWFPEYELYCRRIPYSGKHYDEFEGLKPGDEITVYKFNNNYIFAYCPEPYKLKHF